MIKIHCGLCVEFRFRIENVKYIDVFGENLQKPTIWVERHRDEISPPFRRHPRHSPRMVLVPAGGRARGGGLVRIRARVSRGLAVG